MNPYPAGGDPNGIGENLVYSQIIQHETGHIFWTLDEYPGAPGTCASSSGYLNYANRNLNASGPTGITRCILDEFDCIMNGAARVNLGRPFCRWSKGQLGVIDDNNNAIPDVFEAEPIIRFASAAVETVNVSDFTIQITAVSQAVENRNYRIPEDTRVDYAAPLKDGQFSIGGGWVSLFAADGKWNGPIEESTVRISSLPPGETKVKFRVRNAVGQWSDEYIKSVYYLGVSYSRFGVVPKRMMNEISFETIGETFGATFEVYRLDPGEPLPDLPSYKPEDRLPGTLIAADVQPTGPGANGFVGYRVIDPDVTPGVSYRYFAAGGGEVVLEGNPAPVAFRSMTDVVRRTAMVPVPDGRLMSHAAPNPSSGGFVFSVNVPRFSVDTGLQTSSAAELSSEPTPVDVRVYDVLGRAVRTLHSGGEFESVLTLKWDGTNSKGVPVASGVYFIQVKAGAQLFVEKVLIVR